MARGFVIAAFAGALCAALPAHAQEPELDGAPPPLQVPKPRPKPSAPAASPSSSALKAEQDRLARQAAAQKAEQARLDAQAADLKTQQARLDARAAELAAEEKRLAQRRAELEAETTRTVATDPAPPPLTSPRGSPVRPLQIGYEDARRACTYAGMSEARDRAFDSARYDRAPRWYDRERELRGVMRLDDRRGYVLVDTICVLDRKGDVIDFALLR